MDSLSAPPARRRSFWLSARFLRLLSGQRRANAARMKCHVMSFNLVLLFREAIGVEMYSGRGNSILKCEPERKRESFKY